MALVRQCLAVGFLAVIAVAVTAQDPAEEFQNRWDTLARMEVCDWLSAGEIERGLGLGAGLSLRRIPARCDYVFQAPNGWSERAFSLYVEVHDERATVRETEASFREGFTASLFIPFDAGAPDLNVYVSKKGTYLYVYPENGLTLWRLEYLDDPDLKVALYGDGDPQEDLGRRFMQLLVNKYKDQL